ncbi:UNVERIFIED_CONTAM: Serine carboxypeptidase-like 18, partial [Sesamum calycinum]
GDHDMALPYMSTLKWIRNLNLTLDEDWRPWTVDGQIAGYIGVGEEDEVQLFYYFIQSENDPARDPLILWLTGGPGCSGFSGLVYEIGPLAFDLEGFDGSFPSFTLNPYSWTKIANIIFIDSPVGTGFSYATTSQAYNNSDTKSAQYNSSFLRKWLLNHLEFVKNRLYIAGDSYGGKITPMVALEIAKGNEAGLKPRMSLQGYIVGNAVTDANKGSNEKVPFAHGMGLVPDEYFELAKSSCNGEYVNSDPNNKQCLYALQLVNECISSINEEHIAEPFCNFMSPRSNVSRPGKLLVEDPIDLIFLPKYERTFCRHYNYVTSHIWANDETVREALHIREGTIGDWRRCNINRISYEQDVESVFRHHQLLNEKGFQALIYSGDHDMAISYISTLKWIHKLNLTLERGWRPWFVNGQVAGYIGVGEEDEVQLFYYFIQSENDPARDPLILWLTGGPGCSGFSGLIYEIGPLAFDVEAFDGSLPSLIINPYSWTKIANIIFIDSPVGTGFSYANTSQPYNNSDTKSAQYNYSFLRKYSIARYWGRPGNKKILKLQGYIVGNAVTDTIEGLNERVPFAHGMGLISDEYFECISAINVEHIGELSCNLLSSGPNVSQPGELLLEDPIDLIFLPKHERTFCRRYNYVISYVWANNETVREALHIREGTVTDWQRCNGTLPYEKDAESVFKHHKLLSDKGFRALVYSGDHDMAISYISTLKWIRSLNLTLKEEWRPCFCNNTLVINVANDMVKTKNDNQKKLSQCSTNAPIGILTRARDFYSNTMCHCGGGGDRRSVVNCTVPRTKHVGSSKLENGINEDLQGLMRLLATRKGVGAKVDVDSEGNLVWRIPAAAEGVVGTSYGGGVGKIGRIDEDKPCCFMEVDVNKLTYSSSTSGNNNKIITRRMLLSKTQSLS